MIFCLSVQIAHRAMKSRALSYAPRESNGEHPLEVSKAEQNEGEGSLWYTWSQRFIRDVRSFTAIVVFPRFLPKQSITQHTAVRDCSVHHVPIDPILKSGGVIWSSLSKNIQVYKCLRMPKGLPFRCVITHFMFPRRLPVRASYTPPCFNPKSPIHESVQPVSEGSL